MIIIVTLSLISESKTVKYFDLCLEFYIVSYNRIKES